MHFIKLKICAIWIICLLFLISNTSADIPGCDYFDTVDLTKSRKFENGSYLYEKLVIPSEQTGQYDYEILVDGERLEVPRHVRGCACKLGDCIRFCCHRNQMLVSDDRKCYGDINRTLEFDPYVELTLADGSQVKKHILNELIMQQDLPVPCSGHFYLDANQYDTHGWTLFEDGTLLRDFDNKTLSKQEYCLQPQWIRDSVILVPHFCEDPYPNPWPTTILFILTITCLILTIIVYLSLPKLRNLHGICFICYLLCLLVVYMLLLSDKWKWITTETACQINGYVGYFAVMAGFLWLTVISYDLWNSFRGNNFQQHTPKYRFGMYSCYVWGVAALLTIIVFSIDHTLDAENEDHLPWIPGVALYNCWIKTDDWSAMIYFYGPMSLQIIFNLIMFVLTAVSILNVMDELQTIVARQERQQRLKSDKKTYSLFVRLFVIMGVTWTFEIFSYLVQSHGVLAKMFLFFDYINCAQGVIIFVLFVLKRSVLKLISDRIRGIETLSDDEEEEIVLQERDGDSTRRDIVPSILN